MFKYYIFFLISVICLVINCTNYLYHNLYFKQNYPNLYEICISVAIYLIIILAGILVIFILNLGIFLLQDIIYLIEQFIA